MATGAPLPVREYASADEMRRDAAALRNRMFAPRPEPAPRAPAVQIIPAGRDKYRQPASDAEKIASENEVIAAVEAVTLPATTAQRDGRATLRGTDCLRIVSRVTGLRQSDLVGPSRTRFIVRARQIAAWLLVNRAGKSLPEAGRILGGRDHTTALHSCRCVDRIVLPASAMRGDVMPLVAALWDAMRPELYRRPL